MEWYACGLGLGLLVWAGRLVRAAAHDGRDSLQRALRAAARPDPIADPTSARAAPTALAEPARVDREPR
jgi:hypothetical protein